MTEDAMYFALTLVITTTVCAGTLIARFDTGIRHIYDRWVTHRDHIAELKYGATPQPHPNSHEPKETAK